MDYKRIKRVDIKKWLKQGNAIVYALILVLLIVSLVFIFKTIYSDNNNTEASINQTNSANIEQTTNTVAENQSYKIRVNKSRNFMTILKLDSNGEFTSIYKVFRCSVNSNVQVYDSKITEKSAWRKLDDNVYGHYVSKLCDSVCIHSAPYYKQDNAKLIVSAYNKLGTQADIGYIYLSAADSKWVYENCGINTEVNVYEDANENPPVDLPKFVELSDDTKYDPTEEKNSDIIKADGPKIKYMTGVNDCTIPLNSEFNQWEGIYACDTNNNDITKNIKISGEVNTSIPGVYTLIYKLSDNYGTNLAYYRYVTVTDIQNDTQDNTQNSIQNGTQNNTQNDTQKNSQNDIQGTGNSDENSTVNSSNN